MMTTTADRVAAPARRRTAGRLLRRHGWTVGVYILLAVLVLYWRTQTNLPWGTFDVQSLAIDALPLAFAACGQAIVIISGGIDLSVGSMMSLVNVVAGKYMLHMSFEEALLFSVAIVFGAALAGALTGTIIVVTRVADIIVTLAMLFVWAGIALAVLEVPGGGVPPRYQNLVTIDTVATKWLPSAIVILAAAYAVLWLTSRSTPSARTAPARTSPASTSAPRGSSPTRSRARSRRSAGSC